MAQNPAITSFGTSSQGIDLVPIAPNDVTDLPITARAIRCRPDGLSGTLRFTSLAGQVRNTYIASGSTLQVMVVRVHATGTTATLLEAYL